MIPVTGLAGQYWVITPAATAIIPPSTSPHDIEDVEPGEIFEPGSPVPARIPGPQWLLVLSGVVAIDFEGNGPNLRKDTVQITPDLTAPLSHAVTRFGVHKPKAPFSTMVFQVQQWAPFVALSSVVTPRGAPFGRPATGFAVDDWRPSPFGNGDDAFGTGFVANVFSGIQADMAAIGQGVRIHRLGYNITLLGKIAFLAGSPIP